MTLKEIASVSGKPGLYKVIGQTKNGVIVTSLSDGKKLAMSTSSKILWKNLNHTLNCIVDCIIFKKYLIFNI